MIQTQNVRYLPFTGFARSYLLCAPEGLIAVDVGSIGAADDMVSLITGKLGMDLGSLRYITATHFHIDHIGGIGRLLSRCPLTTSVLFNHRIRNYLEKSEHLSLMKNWRNALLPASWGSAGYVRKFSHLLIESLAGIPIRGLRTLVRLPFSRDRIAFIGNGRDRHIAIEGISGWEMIETPGHTLDSVSFWNPSSGELVCGDLIVNLKKGARLNRFYSDAAGITDTCRRIREELNPKVVYPGHGEPFGSGGNALEAVEAL